MIKTFNEKGKISVYLAFCFNTTKTSAGGVKRLTKIESVCKFCWVSLFVRPTGVYLLDFFCTGIQFYLLLSPYLRFISLLYLDLYVLGDDALIS